MTVREKVCRERKKPLSLHAGASGFRGGPEAGRLGGRSSAGCSAVRLAHLLWEQGVAGSNPVSPTRKIDEPRHERPLVDFFHAHAAAVQPCRGVRPRSRATSLSASGARTPIRRGAKMRRRKTRSERKSGESLGIPKFNR